MSKTSFLGVLRGWLRSSGHYPLARAYVLGAAPEGCAARQALAGLTGRERRALVRCALRAPQSPRAMAALGQLGDGRARKGLMRVFERERARLDAAPGGNGAMMIATAAALWRLDPQPAYVAAIAERLAAAPARGERMWAADALGAMPDKLGEAALVRALEDPDPLVRHIAARALLAVHGVEIDARAARVLEAQVVAAVQDAPGASI